MTITEQQQRKDFKLIGVTNCVKCGKTITPLTAYHVLAFNEVVCYSCFCEIESFKEGFENAAS